MWLPWWVMMQCLHICSKYELITTVNNVAECLNKGDQCDILTLDFSKAFDKVPHACLYQKMSHYGICRPLLTWLQAFLNNRSQYIVVDNMKSCSPCILSGVPQGTVLAPLLFLMYINDLPTCVCNKVRLYADDVFYNLIRYVSTPEISMTVFYYSKIYNGLEQCMVT